MTVDDLKKLDKRLQKVNDPLGNGFPVMYKIVMEVATQNDMPVDNLVLQYVGWKSRK